MQCTVTVSTASCRGRNELRMACYFLMILVLSIIITIGSLLFLRSMDLWSILTCAYSDLVTMLRTSGKYSFTLLMRTNIVLKPSITILINYFLHQVIRFARGIMRYPHETIRFRMGNSITSSLLIFVYTFILSSMFKFLDLAAGFSFFLGVFSFDTHTASSYCLIFAVFSFRFSPLHCLACRLFSLSFPY